MKYLQQSPHLWVLAFLFFVSAAVSAQMTSPEIYLKLADEGELTFEQIVAQTEAHFDIVGRGKGVGYKPFKRWEYEMERSLDANGFIVSKKRQTEAFNSFMKTNSTSRNLEVGFTEMGPRAQTNTDTWSSALGRLTSVGLDPNDENHIIVGAPAGGVWRTTDKGASWNIIYEYATNINIYAVEISHANPDHYWIGTTSEILRSTDAGQSWTVVTGGPDGETNTITMDPTNANVLLATQRMGVTPGVYRSADGGATWAIVHNNGSDAYDVEFKPTNSNVVYASGEGFIAKSTNNGVTWTDIAGGPWNGFGAVMLAVTAHDGNYVYALQEAGGGYNGTFRSINSGGTWTTRSDNSSGMNNILTYDQSGGGGQAPRDMDIVVSPTNKNNVFVAGTELWGSTNSGANFTKVADWLVNSGLPFIHADVDLLYYTPDGLYAGTDGGLFITTNGGTTWTDHTPGIGVRQFYRIGASATDPDRVSGGSQDNGAGVVVNGVWRDYLGADGMETFIDWSNADIMYGNTQFGSLSKSIDGGVTTVVINQAPGGNGEWVTPTEQDPTNANTLYVGKDELYKSTDGANNWTDLTGMNIVSLIDEVEIAPSNNQVIYFSHEETLFKTTNGGATWTDVSPNVNNINYIDVHPTNSNKVLITQMGQVMESTNGGVSWTDITANLPGITYYCGIYQGDATDGIFLGGSYGIWHKDNNTAGMWVNLNGNLPVVPVRELEIRGTTMYVATYARGLWKGTIANANNGMTCANAIELDMPGSYTAPGPSYGNGCFNCASAPHANWFKFTPPLTGKVSIGSCHNGVDTRLWAYSGNCGALTQIAFSDDSCAIAHGSGNDYASLVQNVAVTAGTPIYIEWDDRWSSNSFLFTIEYTMVACPGNLDGVNALVGLQNTTRDYEAAGTISSTQTISGGGVVVDYDSGTDINLNPNFEVVLGAQFNAFIDGCGGAQANESND